MYIDQYYMLKRKRTVQVDSSFFDSPEKVCTLAKNLGLLEAAEEYVYTLALDNKNKATGLFEISHGTVSSSVISPREIYIRALLLGASSIILFHNHPSGDVTPSKDDILVTKRVKSYNRRYILFI